MLRSSPAPIWRRCRRTVPDSPAQEHGPQPDREIGGVEIRSNRGSVACDYQGTSGERVAHKIPGGEVRVDGQIRA